MPDDKNSEDLPDSLPPKAALVPDPSETLMVPPPNFRERLLAAQRARILEVRPSTDFPLPTPPSSPDVAADAAPAKSDPPPVAP